MRVNSASNNLKVRSNEVVWGRGCAAKTIPGYRDARKRFHNNQHRPDHGGKHAASSFQPPGR